MLIKKIKILLLVVFYFFFLILLFTETFFSDFKEVRRSIFIDANKTETLIISKTTWDSFSDKSEFKYNGDYYDVKSFDCENEVVKIKVIKDSFEIILKTISKNTASKNKKSESFKNKKIINFYYFKTPTLYLFTNKIISKINYSYVSNFQDKYLFSIFRPPLFN